MDESCFEVWGANFASQQGTENFMKLARKCSKQFNMVGMKMKLWVQKCHLGFLFSWEKTDVMV